ncbi:segregation/condensation protein A [Candidatus Woesearchaeota archaeon]|nr:segregation/condensation protein A [Candidatus Woesearchaeota archaeon]
MEEQRKLYEILVQKNDVTWQSIIQDLVKKGEIDPWNIDISWISQEYLKEIKKMQEMNFFISGKMILASAILLKLKSEKLLNEDIASLDHIMFPSDNIDELDDFLPNEQKKLEFIDNPNLTIRTPQARKRRVSIADLISALEQALEINTKRLLRKEEAERIPTDLMIPEKKIDINKLIEELFEKIIIYLKEKNDLKFNNLLSEKPNRDEIIGTFVPLLHLDNQQRIKLEQEKHFGEINIRIK